MFMLYPHGPQTENVVAMSCLQVTALDLGIQLALHFDD